MDLQTSIAHRLNYWKQQRNIIKAHQARATLVSLRKDWLEKQKKTNYQNEYDRIRAILNDSVLPGTSKEHIRERVKKLENMGVSNRFDNMV